MTSPGDIFPHHLYPGGYSTCINISTFFYMFLMVEGEHPFMGLIHPMTGVLYWYKWLPMGSCNSPTALGHFSMVFIHLALDSFLEFQGEAQSNDFSAFFWGNAFDLGLGYGCVLIGSDEEPVCLLWIHVDDSHPWAQLAEDLECPLKTVDPHCEVGSDLSPRQDNSAMPRNQVLWFGLKYGWPP